MIRFFLIIVLLFCCDSYAKDTQKSINTWKKGVVTINNKVIKSPYNPLGSFNGSGFIIDKKLGLILTNKHVVSQTNINETYITIASGRELEADVIYSDPMHDFSFLKVADPQGLADMTEFKLSPVIPHINENVTIIGNNDNQSFSIQKGIVTSIYELSNYFPSQTIRISLNARGGSSGSPIINNNGEVVAINFAVDSTYSYALPAGYLNDALHYIKDSQTPKRRDIGVLYDFISMDSAKRYFALSDEALKYSKINLASSQNKLIIVNNMLPDSPANDKLQVGDILLKVNDKPIGANLYELQKTINQNKEVKFELLRFGKIISTTFKTTDLSSHQITKLIEFGGALFYEADDFISLLSGAKPKQVFISAIENGGSFEAIPSSQESRSPKLLLNIESIDQKKISSISDLKDIIYDLKSKQHFVVFFRNFYGRFGYNKSYFTSRALEFQDIQHSPYEGDAILYELDQSTKVWKTKKIWDN